RIVNFISYVGISMPVFWFALLLVYLFSLKLNLLPSGIAITNETSKEDPINPIVAGNLSVISSKTGR
ncbi:hypothetical protein JVW17_21035, partial [Vibrio cholerae O1]|nr:hypothetical protein [Vibrio cholerae O1]